MGPTPARGNGMTDKKPEIAVEPDIPRDPYAETQLLGALLVDDDAPDLVADLLSPEDFLDDKNRQVFQAIMRLQSTGVTVDQVTVADALGADLASIGTRFLSNLTTEVITADPVAVEHYAAILRRMSTLRNAITTGSKIVALAYRRPRDVDGFLVECEQLVASLTGTKRDDLTPIAEILDAYWSEPGVMTRDTKMLRTGYPDLDKVLCGIGPGNLCLVAARPGMGKSNFVLSAGRNAAIGQGWRVGIISLEMERREWAVRLLARETGVPGVKIRDGNLQDLEQQLAYSKTVELAPLPIYVRDKGHDTVEKIRAQARRLKAAHGLDLLIIDYLQLINGRQRQSRYEEVSQISRSLKVLAVELEIPVMAAAQLNREVEKRKPPRPTLADLRDSGSLEQDADQVLLLYRADKYVKRENWRGAGPYPAGQVEVIVAKNRHGPTGSAWVRIDDTTGRIDDVEHEEARPAPWSR